MGLFNLFKKPVIIQDDVFGQLRYTSFKDPSKSYFSGKGFFAPTNADAEYSIPADISGPTESQKQFYINLQKNFDQYVEKMKPLIEDEFRNWKEDFAIEDFNKEFTLESISIPRLDSTPAIWDMYFITIHDKNHWVIVDFVGDSPNGVMIDG